MSTTRLLSFCLIVPAILLAGCVGKVSGRFDLEQKFRSGVPIKGQKFD